MSRGPICGEAVGSAWIDSGTQARMRTPPGGGGSTLSEEELQLLLDLSQMTLDLVGIVDPTPISDGTNAGISVSRGDWFGAGISAVAMVPLLGDLAKIGKLGRWAQTVEKAIALMRRNARFAEKARPVLRRLAELLAQVPTVMLPEVTRPLVQRLRNSIDTVLLRIAQPARRVLLQSYWKIWDRYLDNISFPNLSSGEGVLWSRLPDGADHAKVLASAEGRTTLEMQLAPLKLEEKYRAAVAQLTELMGDDPEIWEHFGRKVWEKISRRYAETLSGRVRAHVQFGGGRGLEQMVTDLEKKTRAGHEAIIWDELEQIAEWMSLNPRISSVELVDIFSGRSKVMLREDVLRASRGTQ